MAEDMQAPTVADLLAELERARSWDGLMETLDEHYPPEVVDGSSGDPGARIVVLTRALAAARAENACLQERHDLVVAGLTEHGTKLTTIAVLRDRLLLTALGGRDTTDAVAAVNEAEKALGWGLTVLPEVWAGPVLRALVKAREARVEAERAAIAAASDVGREATKAFLGLLKEQDDCEVALCEAWEAAEAFLAREGQS
jgi:hypothetical protein